jgi:SnoaL-like domain
MEQKMQRMLDRAEIIRLVQSWGFLRDDHRWDELRALYAPEALQTTSWSVGTATEFIDRCIAGAKKPAARRSMHSIGASIIEINGERALAETRRTILTRAVVHGIEVDVTNHGRSFDWLVRLDGEWKIKLRSGIYERDRMDPVDPAKTITLDAVELAKYPEGYCHLAYLQAGAGERISPHLPTPNSAALAKLYADGRAWLDGNA